MLDMVLYLSMVVTWETVVKLVIAGFHLPSAGQGSHQSVPHPSLLTGAVRNKDVTLLTIRQLNWRRKDTREREREIIHALLHTWDSPPPSPPPPPPVTTAYEIHSTQNNNSQLNAQNAPEFISEHLLFNIFLGRDSPKCSSRTWSP